jgi:hypothetical protein
MSGNKMKLKHGIIVHVMKYSGIGFDPDYQIENSELKQRADRVRKMRGDKISEKTTPGEGLDYITKNAGELHAAGFIRTMACQNQDKSFTHFESMTNKERRDRVLKAWRKHASKFPKTYKDHHRLVFSMSKEMHDKLVEKGINPEMVLHQALKRSLRNFTDKFHKGDSLGYTYGFHHDTDNLHAHVFVHPRTKFGERVSFSSQLKGRKPNGQVDKLNFLKESLATQVRSWEKKLEDPKVREALQKHIHAEKFTFTPKPRVPIRPTVLVGSPEYNEWMEHRTRLQNQFQNLKELESDIRSLRMKRAAFKVKKNAIRLLGYRPSMMEKAFGKIAKEISYSILKAKQDQRFQLQESYRMELREAKRFNQFMPINSVVMRNIKNAKQQNAHVQRTTPSVKTVQRPIAPGAAKHRG